MEIIRITTETSKRKRKKLLKKSCNKIECIAITTSTAKYTHYKLDITKPNKYKNLNIWEVI